MGAREKNNNTKLSVVIITKNEAKNLTRLLPSLNFADDVIILDSGSTDNTKEVALRFGARFFQEEWRGFGLQKRRASELASHDWILSVDADEFLPPELITEVLDCISEIKPRDTWSFKIPRISFFLKRWIRHGGWYPDYQLRLFHRKHFQWNADTIHEKVVPIGSEVKVGVLKKNLEHFVFNSISDQVETNNRYSSLLAERDFARGQKAQLFHIVIKPWIKFFECYFLKLGILDGLPGFIIAINAAHSIFLRKVKLWEKRL